ncbi:heterokaryon incompatibility protein-domain-containing protein [Echria macrotheca]|uniref:Heterokaryon incompatibility protein-domain-containing protein n=1 Tax=Echria macrotheca TaxID=438768 RepID=A0AAJ0B2G9_9PEZI|nr:heterokaryon incompatibility protein-domain-containing protein [Echria macrotheca]
MKRLRSLWHRLHERRGAWPGEGDRIPGKLCDMHCAGDLAILLRYRYDIMAICSLQDMVSGGSRDCQMCIATMRRLSHEVRLRSEGRGNRPAGDGDDVMLLWAEDSWYNPPYEVCIYYDHCLRGTLTRWNDKDPLDTRFLFGDGQIDVGQASRWLARCQTDHGETCVSNRDQGAVEEAIDLILVDIDNARLVVTTSNQAPPYVALSYVWGGVASIKTTLSNFTHLRQKGALDGVYAQLPRVVRDAITLVRGLGLGHLWVDVLCVVQDDYTNKPIMLSHMGRIYSWALLTIVAACGSDAADGLVGVAPGSRSPILTLTTPLEGVDVLGRPPALADMLRVSQYETRGWTFQERVLSTRCLYISDQQMYFQCRATIEQEDGFYSGSVSSVNPLLSSATQFTTTTRYDLFETYMLLVKLYSQRQLTYECDVLDAFQGIFDSISRQWGCSLFASGIPDDILDLALLWRPGNNKVKYRRREPQGGASEPEHRPRNFPIWCWSGWSGPVTWLLDDDHARTIYSRLWQTTHPRRVDFIPNHQDGMVPFRPVIPHFRLCSGGQIVRTIQRNGLPPAQTALDSSTEAMPLGFAVPQSPCDMLLFTAPCVAADEAVFFAEAHDHCPVFVYDLLTKENGFICGNLCPMHTSRVSRGERLQQRPGYQQSFVLIGMVEQGAYSPNAYAWGFLDRRYGNYGSLRRNEYSPLAVFLLVERQEGSFAERLGIGLVLMNDWEACHPVQKTIFLA